jgi:hypothetical protein
VTIQYEVKPEREEYPLLDEIRLHLTIRNVGGAALELVDPSSRSSQPTYTLRGPSFPKGRTFNKLELEGLVLEPQPAPDSDKIRIEPGASWDGIVSLARSVRPQAPGDYELTSRLQLPQVQAQSPSVVFRVKQLSADSADAGIGLREDGAGEGEVAFLQRTESGALLYAQQFHEVRRDVGEVKMFPLQLRRHLEAQATDVRVPWTNATFHAETARWLIWREGATVAALDTYDTLISARLPAAPAALVRPALKAAGEPPEVLAIAEGGRALQLVRFDGAGKVEWTAALPAQAKAIVAGLGPERKGSPRHVAFAAHTQEGIAIYHSRYARDGALTAFESVAFDARKPGEPPRGPARLLDDSTAALHVEGKDEVWAGFLARDGEETLWLEAHFARGLFGSDNSVRSTRLGPLAGKPLGGALLYVDDKSGSIARREVVLLLDTGKLVHVSDATLREASLQGTPTIPLLLAPGREFTYVLYADKVRGPYFASL